MVSKMNLQTLTGRSIVFLAKNNPWQSPSEPGLMFFPCLLARRLADCNRVLWVGGISRHPVKVFRYGLREVCPNLFAYLPWSIAPRSGYVYLNRISALLYGLQVRWCLWRLGMQRPIFWAAQVPCGDVLPFLPQGPWIYGVGDVLLGPVEDTFLSRVDVLLVLSEVSFEELSRRYHSKTFLYSTGVDMSLWSLERTRACPEPSDLCSIPRPRAGFIGNITEKRIDFPLLQSLATENHDVSFVLIGPAEDFIRERYLRDLGNVYVLPPKSYSELPLYVRHLDVGLIPYQLNAFNRGTNPNKVYEYFALGKPVIMTPIPSLLRFQPYLYVADNAQMFNAVLRRILREGEPLEFPEKRKAIARQHSVETVLERIDRWLRELRVLD